jgi:hypothetical protein
MTENPIWNLKRSKNGARNQPKWEERAKVGKVNLTAINST